MMKLFKTEKMYKKSFSQQGEDLTIEFILKGKGIEKPYYLDIGANHPVIFSNTYLFYLKGGRGVCIDPNVSFKKLYQNFRPADLFIPIGVTGGATNELPYYVMNWHEFNSFDKEQAANVEKEYAGRNNIKEVVTLPVVNINEVLSKNIRQKIDVLNLDVEGFDLEILKAWDFDQFAPGVICVETKDLKTGGKNAIIENLLKDKGYSLLANNLINGIFSK